MLLIDAKTQALVRLAAAISVGAGNDHLRQHVMRAIAEGAADDEVVGTLIAIGPEIGIAGTVNSINGVALGLGYDIDGALEEPPVG